MEPSQDDCVDLVCLHAGVGDRANHPRAGHDHSLDERSHYSLDSCAIAGRFDHDIIFTGKRLCELDETIVNQISPLLALDLPVQQERHVKER